MPQLYEIGRPFTKAEGQTAIDAIVPPRWRSELGYAHMVTALVHHLPNWFAHEINRARGLAYTSGEHGFSHKEMRA